jgi:hypothetical protein
LKSGSNKLHGNYGYSYETPKLQSDNTTPAYAAAGLLPNPLVSYYDYGLDLGGPILRDKLWYYAAYARQARDSKVLGWTDTRLSKVRGPDGKFYTTVVDPAPNNLKQVSTALVEVVVPDDAEEPHPVRRAADAEVRTAAQRLARPGATASRVRCSPRSTTTTPASPIRVSCKRC